MGNNTVAQHEHERRSRAVSRVVAKLGVRHKNTAPTVAAVERHMSLARGSLYTYLGAGDRDAQAELDLAWKRAGYSRPKDLNAAQRFAAAAPEEGDGVVNNHKEEGRMRRVSERTKSESATAWDRVEAVLKGGMTYAEMAERVGYASAETFRNAYRDRTSLSLAKRDAIAVIHREHLAATEHGQGPATVAKVDNHRIVEQAVRTANATVVWGEVLTAGRMLAEALEAARDVTPPALLAKPFHVWEATASEILDTLGD